MFQQLFPRPVDIPRAHGKNQVPGLSQSPEGVGGFVEGRTVDRAGDFPAEVSGGDAQGILLPGGVDFGKDHDFGDFQLFHKAVKELGGPGIGMGLESDHKPFVAHAHGGGQEGVELVGMVGVIVIDFRAVVGPLMLEPPPGTRKGGESLLHGFSRQAQHVSRRRSRQCVQDVMLAPDMKLHVGVKLPMDCHVERRTPRLILIKVNGGAFGPRFQSKGKSVQAIGNASGPLVVVVDHHAAIRGDEFSKLPERMLDIVQVLEEIQMIGLHVQNHGHGGEEAQEAVAVFAGFQDNGVPLSHPVAGMEHGQGPADHHGRVFFRGHKDMRTHGGGSGFAMGARDTKGVGVMPHQSPPSLSAFIDRDSSCDGPGNFRIAVAGGGGTDHQVAVPEIFGAVACGNGNSQIPQALHGNALAHVGPLYRQALGAQDFRQRAHGDAADSHQMGADTGDKIAVDGLCIVQHKGSASFPKTVIKNHCNITEILL